MRPSRMFSFVRSRDLHSCISRSGHFRKYSSKMSKRGQTAISFIGDDGQRLIAIGVVRAEACPHVVPAPRETA